MTPLLTHSLMTFGAVPGLDIVDLMIGLVHIAASSKARQSL